MRQTRLSAPRGRKREPRGCPSREEREFATSADAQASMSITSQRRGSSQRAARHSSRSWARTDAALVVCQADRSDGVALEEVPSLSPEDERNTDIATAARLFDDFIKLEWQDIFRKEIHVKLDNGARYVPNGGSQGVQLLRKGGNAFHEAVRVWSGPTDDPDSGTQGYDRIVEQAGIEYTWEWFLIDPSRPWANAVPALVRERIEADLARRDQNAMSAARARATDAERAADEEDDHVITLMNQRRVADGKEPLTEQQERSVREGRRARRDSSA